MLSSHRILLLTYRFPIKIVYFLFVNSEPSTRPAYRNLPHFLTISTQGDMYISGSSSLFNTHYSHMPSSHKAPHDNIKVGETSENTAMFKEVHYWLPMEFILSQVSPVHTLTHHSFKVRFNIILRLTL
jgi:hypothetical protein